jgi:hypothetical protein
MKCAKGHVKWRTIKAFCITLTVSGLLIYYGLMARKLAHQPEIALPSIPEASAEEKLKDQTQFAERILMPELIPALVAIAKCESGGTHYEPNGEVKRGRIDPRDIGLTQINLYHNGELPEQLGFDVFKEADNIRMRNFLYVKNGARDWSASAGCHGNYSTVASL